MILLKILAGLVGLIGTLGGVAAFGAGLWLGATCLLFDPSGPRLVGGPAESPPDAGLALACVAGGVVAIYLGAQLGRFARGDFD